jgi:hypothetical protein
MNSDMPSYPDTGYGAGDFAGGSDFDGGGFA